MQPFHRPSSLLNRRARRGCTERVLALELRRRCLMGVVVMSLLVMVSRHLVSGVVTGEGIPQPLY